MPWRIRWPVSAVAALVLLAPEVQAQEGGAQRQSVEELRNTVINILQTLVEKGVITREQAEAMVKSAQAKAAASAAAVGKQQKDEEGAVRVPYVPQIVQDQIKKDVVTELGPSIKQDVAEQLNSPSTWSFLPNWIRRMTWSGDLRVRLEGDLFDSNNVTGVYLNYNVINSMGGIAKAGPLALLNTTEDQDRLRLRARFGFDSDLGSGWTAALRLATGSTGEVVATTNQTLGTYGAGYTVTLDQAFLRWSGTASDGDQVFTAYGGRFSSPWVGTDLVWYNDLTFEGVVGNYRLNLGSDGEPRKELFVTIAGLPLSSYSPLDNDPTAKQKWLLGGQLGSDLLFEDDSRLRLAAAYYDYIHIVGERNTAPDGTQNNWSAPAFVQKGNTMFDIANPLIPNSSNLFALAANFRIVDLIAIGDLQVSPRYALQLTMEALRNVGFNTAEVSARVGTYVAPRTSGYRADVSFGTTTPPAFGNWRASIGYRYLQRDAVIDAFNDEDFHLGGTDTKGYTVLFDFSFNPHVWMRMKYMSANEIDGPSPIPISGQQLGIDVWQLDVNTVF